MNFTFPFKEAIIHLVKEFEYAPDLLQLDSFTSLNQNQYVLHVPGVADFKVENGRDIYMKLRDNFDENAISLYLNASVLAAYLYQNQILALHASAFEYQGGAVLICGISGAGKSSMVYAINKTQGFPILADDLSIVHIENRIELIPFSDRMKLWGETLANLKVEKEFQQIRPDIDKYFVPIEEAFGAVPIKAIFVLTPSDHDPDIQRINGMEVFSLLYQQIFRPEYLEGMSTTKIKFFSDLGELSTKIPVYHYRRSNANSIEQNSNYLIDFLNSEELK